MGGREKKLRVKINRIPISPVGPKGLSALPARTNAAQMVVAENPSSVPVSEGNLDSVIPHSGSSLRARFGLEHGQRRGSRGSESRGGAGGGRFADALIITGSAGAFFA